MRRYLSPQRTNTPSNRRGVTRVYLRRVGPLLVFVGALGLWQFSSETSCAFESTGSGVYASSHTATLLPSGKVLAAGGVSRSICCPTLASSWLYDPAGGTWTRIGDMTTPRDSHTATLLPNGKVLVAAGHYDGIKPDQSLASAELYDPATGTWAATGSLVTGRESHTATLLPMGKYW